MTRRYLAAVAAVAVVALLVPLPVAGQARTPWGDPDLQGVWDHRTLTPLERPDQLAGKEVFTEEEAAQFQAEQLSDIEGRDDAVPADIVGNYNQFWFDRGTTVVATRRTSRIVDPSDGRLPPLTPEAQRHSTSPEAQRVTQAGRGIVPRSHGRTSRRGPGASITARPARPSTLVHTTIISSCFRRPAMSRFSTSRFTACGSSRWMAGHILDPGFGSGWEIPAGAGTARF